MQYKNNKKQTKKQIRRAHERIGATVLILGILAGTVAISSEARRIMAHFALRPAYAVVKHSMVQAETPREPLDLDSPLRAPHVSGS